MQSYGRMLLSARRGIASITAGTGGISGSDFSDDTVDEPASTTTTGIPSSSGSGGSNGPENPTWLQSSVTWIDDTNPNVTSIPAAPGFNASFAFDNDVLTVARFDNPAPPAWMLLNFDSCIGVAGIRFRFTNLPTDVTIWQLYAAPDIDVGF